MAKQRSNAFGIADDGISIKLASLTRTAGHIYLQALEQVELEQSLYQHPGEKAPEITTTPADDINLDDFTVDNVASYKTQPYEALFETYSLNQGIIAINTFEEQIIKIPVNSPDVSQKQKNKLVKESLQRSEFREGKWQTSVVTINDQSELWVHHGANKLLEILEDTALSHKYKYFFQLADANEVALANLFVSNQLEESSDSCMVLYLGSEYRRALLFEGNKWTFSLPIHVPQHLPDIDIIYSKLSLAMDEAHIADPKNLVICGDFCTDETIVFLRNQLPNTNVDVWKLPALNLDADASQIYDAAQIARFILPIALAWKAMNMDSSTCIRSNFLPSYVIEGQKVFKIAWHGYMMLFLLFFSTLYFTRELFRMQFNLQQEKLRNKELFDEYTSKKDQAEKMMTMAKAIDIQTANIEVIKSLLVGKNPWTEVITRINNSFQAHPISWVTNLRKSARGFQISGVTTNRNHIVVFANLFPNSSISKVFKRKIHSFVVWEFEMDFAYPEVNWYEMMEADVQQLRKYQEQQADKAAGSKQKEEKASEKEEKTTSTIKENVEKARQAISSLDKQKAASKTTIDMLVAPSALLSDRNDPAVKAYKEIIQSFNNREDWLLIDLGVKFINNYQNSPLRSYVRWYLSYRAWQNKQYDRPIGWLEPILKTSDSTKPYALLLLGAVYRDSKDINRSEEFLRMILDNYPQHQVAKTARKLLSEKK